MGTREEIEFLERELKRLEAERLILIKERDRLLRQVSTYVRGG